MSHSPIPIHDSRWEVLGYFAADPTTLPQLPTEVWERVLDQLDVLNWDYYESRERTFSACCSTCRAWLPRSRYHLFKTVIVQSKEQVKQVSKLLHSIPALRTRVETLTVRGSEDAKEDASWIGLVGFHLGSKLKALETITISSVNLSLTKLDSYQLWGAFNKAWQPGVEKKLHFYACTVTHVNQLVRFAFVTKAEELKAVILGPVGEGEPTLPVPALPPGISLPLRRLSINSYFSKLVSAVLWHILARRCPSLSAVDIDCRSEPPHQPPDNWPFLVSLFDMFYCMQRHNNTNHITLSDFIPFPNIEMRTRPDGTKTDNAPPIARSPLRRELVLNGRLTGDPVARFARVLTCFEDAIVSGPNNINRGFHRIKVDYSIKNEKRIQALAKPTIGRQPQENPFSESSKPRSPTLTPDSCRPLDVILSRLHVTTPDVHMIIKEERQPQNGCVLPQIRELLPMFCQLLPNAFCDPDGGQPCLSHPSQVGGSEQGQGVEVQRGMVEEVTEGEQDEETSKTDEEMEGEEFSEEEGEIHDTR